MDERLFYGVCGTRGGGWEGDGVTAPFGDFEGVGFRPVGLNSPREAAYRNVLLRIHELVVLCGRRSKVVEIHLCSFHGFCFRRGSLVGAGGRKSMCCSLPRFNALKAFSPTAPAEATKGEQHRQEWPEWLGSRAETDVKGLWGRAWFLGEYLLEEEEKGFGGVRRRVFLGAAATQHQTQAESTRATVCRQQDGRAERGRRTGWWTGRQPDEGCRHSCSREHTRPQGRTRCLGWEASGVRQEGDRDAAAGRAVRFEVS